MTIIRIRKITSLYMCVLLMAGIVLTGCGDANALAGPDASVTGTPIESSGDGLIADAFSNDKNAVNEQESAEEAYNRRMQALVDALTPMWDNTGKYRTAFDMTELYADVNAFNEDYNNVMEWADSFSEYEGTLSEKEAIYNYFHSLEDEEIRAKYNRMLMYVQLGEALDITDSYYMDLDDRLRELEERFAVNTSFAATEIMELPYEQRLQIFEDPMFDDMDYYLAYYTAPDSEDLPKETRDKIAAIKTSEDDGFREYQDYRYTGYEAPVMNINGRELSMTDDNYSLIMQQSNERELKIAANRVYEEGYIAKADDFAEALEKTVENRVETAKLYGCDSTLEMAAGQEGIDSNIYGMVIGAAGELAPDYQRYMKLHAKGLNLDKQYLFDLETSVSDYEPEPFSYDAAVDIIRNAVSVLGDDYVSEYDEIVGGSNVDGAMSDNRSAGNFTLSTDVSLMPHIFINYYGEYSDLGNLAHETGHAVNYRLTNQTQPQWYSRVATFDTEVCSTVHELLLSAYMVQNASDDEERLYYLEKLLNTYNVSFFTPCMYSEFEDYLYKTVEDGGNLDAQEMNEKMSDLMVQYRGDALEDMRPQWMCVDHLHYGYYMYEYATSICYASSIVQGILSGDEKSVTTYKEFMKMGNSADPVEVLKIAGVDPLDKNTYKKANDYYRSLVDEYEAIIESR